MQKEVELVSIAFNNQCFFLNSSCLVVFKIQLRQLRFLMS